MPTILSFMSGRQLTDADGAPLPGAKLRHYRANTLTPLTVYTNQDGNPGLHSHATPVVCDAGGFVPIIYIDNTSDWKVVTTDQNDIAQPQHSYDLLPAAPTSAASVGFAPPLITWSFANAAGSPYTLLASNAGGAYEADTTAGSITFNLPSAASVGNGKGFIFKKTSSANSMIIDPAGAEVLDNSSTALTITRDQQAVGIFSNGAEWFSIMEFGRQITFPTVQRFTAGSGTYTPSTGTRFIRVRMVGGGGGGAAQTTNNGTNGGDTSFGTWTAIHGNGGVIGATGTNALGGTGGVNGTGALIVRLDGQDGMTGVNFNPTWGGPGGSTPFGGGGAVRDRNPGSAAKANTGSGGGAGGVGTAPMSGSGAAGEYVEFFVSAPTATAYAVGAAGVGGAAGTLAGGNGAAGLILIEEFY